ncbi:hypothetical protein [Paracoccus sp. ME4]|uniref:hypothetical protein n=1 Tax=Paracoccus sp. ME4 TaxID=3138066 RepID=UPI00398AC8C7
MGSRTRSLAIMTALRRRQLDEEVARLTGLSGMRANNLLQQEGNMDARARMGRVTELAVLPYLSSHAVALSRHMDVLRADQAVIDREIEAQKGRVEAAWRKGRVMDSLTEKARAEMAEKGAAAQQALIDELVLIGHARGRALRA